MPFYEIQHSHTLTPNQRSSLATKITNLHATTFTVPSIFVNVRFSPVSPDEDFFYGGRRRYDTNRVFAHVRSGKSRGKETFDGLAEGVEKIWHEVMGVKGPGLSGVFVVPGLVAREVGLAIPEVSWLSLGVSTNIFEIRKIYTHYII